VIHTPSIPPPYVAGRLTVPSGVVSNLLSLIQEQLFNNCPGTAVELKIWAALGNVGAITVGAATQLNGPLTQDNYAFKLLPTGPEKIYRSTYPGSSVPIGDIQLLAASEQKLHVEVQL
jgi:hypothetical protein